MAADGWRPARLGDVTILVPARTSLPFLEDALDRPASPSGPSRARSSTPPRTVRDLLMVLRAVDDPTDHLQLVVGAAHAPVRLRRRRPLPLQVGNAGAGGATSPTSPTPFRRRRSGPRSASTTCASSTTSGTGWPRRSSSTGSPGSDGPSSSASPRAGPATCGGACASSSTRPGRGARPPAATSASTWPGSTSRPRRGPGWPRPILPETDDDAVRIMTIHSAKGLEFPITVVSGMSTVPRAPPGPGGGGLPAGRSASAIGWVRTRQTDEYAEWAPIDEQMGLHERIRLLYVACTRARTTSWCPCTARPGRRNPLAKHAPTPSCCSTAWGTGSSSCRRSVPPGGRRRPGAGRPPPPLLPARSGSRFARPPSAGAAARPRWRPPR